MKTALDTRQILDTLETQHPDADTELHYTTPFELLVATILSAQSTDAGVNQVTPALFKRYPNAVSLAKAVPTELESMIHATGFFRQKARALIGMATTLVEQHGGNVPPSMDDLVELPGVGRKTANVVLGHALGVPGLPVDRHVLRVSNRIGIAEGDDAVEVETQLCEKLPSERWTRTSDTLILHGRRICKPQPLCAECLVTRVCDYFQTVVRQDAQSPTKKVRTVPAQTPARATTGARARKPPPATPARTPKGAAALPSKTTARKRR